MLELVASRQHGNGVRAEIQRHGSEGPHDSEGAFHVEVIDPKAPLENERAPVFQTATTLEAAKQYADDTVAATGHHCDAGCQGWQSA